jgi:peptide/nickel transport system ATP-binding protein
MSGPLFEAIELSRRYRLPRETLFSKRPELLAVDNVSFTIAPGKSFGIVGESGSGKSTLARLAMALDTPTSGEARLMGRAFSGMSGRALRDIRAHMQMVFQDPYGSLDPRQSVQTIIAEPLLTLKPGAPAATAVAEALAEVGLSAADARKYPHEFSGGQRQRIAIARALITRPKLVVADEPVSALDISVQAQVLNLMIDLKERLGVSYLLISHDLAVVEHICDEVAVMYRGRFVETGPIDAIFAHPAHPYTQALFAAAPRLSTQRRPAPEAPALNAPPVGGCAYAPRCPLARDRCLREAPALRPLGDGRGAACHFA